MAKSNFQFLGEAPGPAWTEKRATTVFLFVSETQTHEICQAIHEFLRQIGIHLPLGI